MNFFFTESSILSFSRENFHSPPELSLQADETVEPNRIWTLCSQAFLQLIFGPVLLQSGWFVTIPNTTHKLVGHNY